jgi:hypothetical protein
MNMDKNTMQGGCIAMVGSSIFFFFGVMTFFIQLSGEPKTGGILLWMLAALLLVLGGAGIYGGWRVRKQGKATGLEQEKAGPRPTGKPPAKPEAIESVEAIVAWLRAAKLSSPLCHLVLFGDRPLAGKRYSGTTGEGDSLLAFSSQTRADAFLEKYRRLYLTTQPLSVVPVDSAETLWELLTLPAIDPLYRPPYGLLMNFNYGGEPFHAFSVRQIVDFGAYGLQSGLSQIL